MKTIARILGVALVSVIATTLNFGCASAPTTGGGITLDQTDQKVEMAMLKFRDESIASNLTTAEREGIQKAYQAYRTAYNAALAEAGSDKKAAASDSVKAAADDVVARVAAIP